VGVGGKMAGKVLWHVTMSLDGFIAGPEDAMDWMNPYGGPNPVVEEVIRSIGAALGGRRGYDLGRKPGLPPEFRKIYGGAWSGPVFVLTHHPPDDEEDETITFLSGDIRAAVATARQAANGKNLLILGANIAHQCIEAGLIDEIQIHLAPVLLGEGVRFFDRSGAAPVGLETIAVSQAGQISNLRFRVIK
jgi:dihydrofolate reductase